MYTIKLNYMIEDVAFNGTLEEAMAFADKEAAYTQQNIQIMNEQHVLVAERQWCGVEYDDDCSNPICFGDFGYFSDWTIL